MLLLNPVVLTCSDGGASAAADVPTRPSRPPTPSPPFTPSPPPRCYYRAKPEPLTLERCFLAEGEEAGEEVTVGELEDAVPKPEMRLTCLESGV